MSMTPETRSDSHDTLPALRKAFERWLNPGQHAGNVSPWVEPGRYEKDTHNLAWLAWQAATAQQAAEVQRLHVQRRELQAERERLLGSLARAGLEGSRMVLKERERCVQACLGEYLEDPQPTEGDVAYTQAVADCIAAILRAARQDGAGAQP